MESLSDLSVSKKLKSQKIEIQKWHKKTFGDDRHVHYFDCGDVS